MLLRVGTEIESAFSLGMGWNVFDGGVTDFDTLRSFSQFALNRETFCCRAALINNAKPDQETVAGGNNRFNLNYYIWRRGIACRCFIQHEYY